MCKNNNNNYTVCITGRFRRIANSALLRKIPNTTIHFRKYSIISAAGSDDMSGNSRFYFGMFISCIHVYMLLQL